MPRPKKCRRVCSLPQSQGFAPIGRPGHGAVQLSVDEYEALRLIDLEGLTHEQCAAQMDVARTTVTGIYESARRKIADALVNGRRLVIGGGDFALCEHRGGHCGPGCCCKDVSARNSVKTHKGEETK